MDIKVRKVDPMAIKKIDEMAKEKSISREAYLRLFIEKLAQYDAFLEERNRFEETMKNVMKVLNVAIDSLQRNEQEVKRLKSMFAMILNEDEEEFVTYLGNFKNGDSNE
mgnify:CR=1 FL=1